MPSDGWGNQATVFKTASVSTELRWGILPTPSGNRVFWKFQEIVINSPNIVVYKGTATKNILLKLDSGGGSSVHL